MLKYSSAVKSVLTHLEELWCLHPSFGTGTCIPPVAGTLLMPIWVFPQEPSWNGGLATSKVTGPGGWLHPMPDQCLMHDGHEFEQAPGVGDGQGSLACCSPWVHKESDTTERLYSTELNISFKKLL